MIVEGSVVALWIASLIEVAGFTYKAFTATYSQFPGPGGSGGSGGIVKQDQKAIEAAGAASKSLTPLGPKASGSGLTASLSNFLNWISNTINP